MGKERLWYYSIFVGTAWFFIPIGAIKTKNPLMFAGLVPMSFSWAFQYDMFYGNLQLRATKEAARLIKEEPERFYLPGNNGICTVEQYRKIMNIPQSYVEPNRSIFPNN